MNKVVELEQLCGEYYKFIFNEYNTDIEGFSPEDIEEWLDEDFKFIAVNDTNEFYNWLDEPDSLLDCKSTCYLIKHIQKWYEDQYGKDSIMDYDKLTPRYIINNLAYITLHEMNTEDLRGLLFEEEEYPIIQN